jgi:hypothetical protein
MNVIKVEPDLDCDTGSLFLHSDVQLVTTQQADVALVDIITTQQKGIQKVRNKVDTATIQEAVPVTLSVKSDIKVRHVC